VSQQYPQQPYPQQQYPQQQYPQQQAGQRPMPTKTGSSGKIIAGVILLAFGGLFFLATAFFGYFAVSNYGAAGRIAAEKPDARWVVRIVEKKAQNQAMMAGAFGFLALALGGGGVGLIVLGRKKKGEAAAPMQQQWATQQAVHPQSYGRPPQV
jgi:hypothetical protein